MALKSGLPGMVPWALNALALSSFSARPELPALPSLPGLLPALLQVLPKPQLLADLFDLKRSMLPPQHLEVPAGSQSSLPAVQP